MIRRVFSSFTAALLLSSGLVADEMSADDAHRAIVRTGLLRSSQAGEELVVRGRFSLSGLGPESEPVEFFDVSFPDGIDAESQVSRRTVVFHRGSIRELAAKGAVWERDLEFRRVEIRRANFADGLFHGELLMMNSDVLQGADFSRTVFRGRVSIRGGSLGGARFSGTEFRGPLALDDVEFLSRVSFVSSEFQEAASFVGARARGPVRFERSVFRGEAEFRRARFASLVVRNADFAGDVDFGGAEFGPSGARFEHVSMSGSDANLEGLTSEGPLVLEDTHAPNLRFRWGEIGGPVLSGEPDPETLAALRRRAEALGRTGDQLRLEYLAAEQARSQRWSDPDVPFFEKAKDTVEYLAWGLTTGYGTRLDRALLVALCLWLFGTLLLLLGPDRLYRVPASFVGSESDVTLRMRPLSRDALPEGARVSVSRLERLLVGLGFTFGLLFKVPSTARYVEANPRRVGMHPTERYLTVLWFLGAYALVLVGLTLSKTSPAIRAIVGELL